MKPVLIVHPISYSSSGKTALEVAVGLARVSGADLHVLELTGRRRLAHDPVARQMTDANVEPQLVEFVQSVDSTDVKISAVELVGDVVDAVVRYAKKTSADMVVVADRGRSHGPYWRRGRYANDLARHLSAPLLSVPASRNGASVPSGLFTRILGAIDLSSSSMTVIEHALSLAGKSGAKVTFLQVDETLRADGVASAGAKAHAEAIARAIEPSMSGDRPHDVQIEALVRPGAIDEGIVNAAADIGADLIVIARPGSHRHVSMNSLLARLLRKAPSPVMIVPATAADGIDIPLASVTGPEGARSPNTVTSS